MAVLMLQQTKEQTDLLGTFLEAFHGHLNSGEALIVAYMKCVESGMDMSPETLVAHGVPERLCLTLAKIAERKLLPEVGAKLLHAPEAVINAISEAGHSTQQKLLDGVSVHRDGTVKVVPINELFSHEARRLFDPVTKRMLSPEEQAERMQPRQARSDQRVTLTLEMDDYNDLAAAAKRAGHAPSHNGVAAYILTVLAKNGAVKGRRRAR
jgi:hypothetical protein